MEQGCADAVTAVSAIAERRFYSGMAYAMIAVVFIGFAPSFYLRGLVHYPRPNPTLSTLILLHGAMFTIWMLIFVAQVRLVAAGRRDLHIRLGLWSMAFAIALVPQMIATTIAQVERASQPPSFSPLAWMAVPAFSIPAFAAFLFGGWYWRRDAQVHKRLMLGTALLMLDPAIGRIPIFPASQTGVYLSDFAGWVPVLALAAWDMRSLGRIHRATSFIGGVMAFYLVMRNVAMTSSWWEDVAEAIVAPFVSLAIFV